MRASTLHQDLGLSAGERTPLRCEDLAAVLAHAAGRWCVATPLLLGMTLVLGCGLVTTESPTPVASVTVAAAWPTATVFTGGTVQLTATTRDASGTVLTGRAVTWATNAPAVATVSPEGVVRGVGPGTATITATSEAKSGTASITVRSLELARISAGEQFTCGVTVGGDGACWGIGGGPLHAASTPELVPGGLRFTAVSLSPGGEGSLGGPGGENQTCWVTAAGGAYCWGGTPPTPPRAVPGGLTFSLVSASGSHACGVTAVGAAYCWGYNRWGVLGDGTTTDRLTPTLVVGGLSFATISTARFQTCGITTAGAAYCWGWNVSGRLGIGIDDQNEYLSPVPVAGGVTFATVSAGGGMTCAVALSGAAYCWGANGNHELGDGTPTDRLTPTLVVGGLSFAAVSTGANHACGITAAGVAYCWGWNEGGQLGDGTRTKWSNPVLVTGGRLFTAVSAGFNHSCGVTSDGAAYCWGRNEYGQLGDGTTEDRLSPTRVVQ